MKMTHNIPSLGKVDVELGEYPTIFYEFLEQEGEVHRLNNLLHIGMLKTCFPGMRHTRWDYTFVSLYMIECLTKMVEGLTATKKVNEVEISGRDMAQLMILASNIGHLPGTFIMEKGLTRALLKNDLLTELIRGAGLTVNISVDYTNINKIIGLARIKQWLKSFEENSDTRMALDLTYSLMSGQFVKNRINQHYQKITSYYWLSRRAAYQILDSLYISLPYTIRYEQLIKNPPSRSPFSNEWIQMVDLLDDYTRVIYDNIYHSENSRIVIARYSNKIFEYFNELDNPLEKMFKLLSDTKIPKDINIEQEHDHIAQVSIPHAFPLDLLSENICSHGVDKLELELVKYKPHIQPSFLYIPGLKNEFTDDKSGGELRFDICISRVNSKLKRQKALANVLVWSKRIKSLWGLWGSSIFLKDLFSGILEQACGEYIFKAQIEAAPNEVFTSQFVDENYLNIFPDDKIMFLSSVEKPKIRRAVRYRKYGKWNKDTYAKYHECKCLYQLALRKWIKSEKSYGIYHLIIPGRIKFIEVSSSKDVCEFDGAFLSIKRKRGIISSQLFLLEAKSGRLSSPTKAKKDIRKALGKLKGLYLKGRVYSLLKTNAYAEIQLV